MSLDLPRVQHGNATQDGEPFRGWFIGHFIPPEAGSMLRATEAVEVKWGIHANGEIRPAWAASAQATSLSLLVAGRIRIFFDDGQEVVLAQRGDYALWPAGVAHRWQIEEDDTVILTVRWPSRAGDAADLPGDGRHD